VADYIRGMRRRLALPVTVVHGGHEPSFGRDRLRALALDYLSRRGACANGTAPRQSADPHSPCITP